MFTGSNMVAVSAKEISMPLYYVDRIAEDGTNHPYPWSCTGVPWGLLRDAESAEAAVRAVVDMWVNESSEIPHFPCYCKAWERTRYSGDRLVGVFCVRRVVRYELLHVDLPTVSGRAEER